MKESFIKKDLIFLNYELTKFEDVVELAGNKMFDLGYVKNSYISAVIDRETTFPTGLETPNGNIAIPHTDKEHVNESAIAVMTLQNPIKVHSMTNPSERLDVKLFFILAVVDPDGQVRTLQTLMGLFKDEQYIRKILNEENVDSVYKLLSEVL